MDSIKFAGSIAENYEKYLTSVFFTEPAKDIISRVPKDTVSILELACGTGMVTRMLREKFPEAKITATDINPDMLKVAKEKLEGKSGIEWAEVNAEEIPYGDNTFDCVICQYGIMFVPDKQKMVGEAFRVLKPGGTFLFNTWDSLEKVTIAGITNGVIKDFFKDDPPAFYSIPFSMYNPSEMEGYMKTAGFNNISVDNVKLEGTSPSAEDAAIGFSEGNPIYTAICERDKNMLPEIKKTLAEKFSKEFGATNLKIPLSLFVTQGTK
jgi:ubiquinone/menaquinone biosynthesis C-methylase UbiE